MSNLTFQITGGTNVGLVRKNNEDNFIVNPNLTQSEWFLPADSSESFEISEYGSLMVVADGMGGMNAGEVASAIAIDTIKEEFTNQDLAKIIVSNRKIEDFLYDVIVKADSNIKAHVKKEPETEGMGTTIVIAWVVGSVAHIAWCGDSRAYLYNSEVGLSRLSKDHSYVQQLVDEGKLDDDLAFDHPNSNIITRSLGDISSKAKPDYMSKHLSNGDTIILCSDGLCGLCRDSEILELLNIGSEEGFNMEQFKNALITAALQAGGYDNVTLTMMKVDNVCQSQSEESKEEDASTLNDFKQASKRKKRSKVVYITILLIVILAVLSIVLVKTNYVSVPSLNSIETTIKELLKPTKSELKVAPTEETPAMQQDATSVKPQKVEANTKRESKTEVLAGKKFRAETKKTSSEIESKNATSSEKDSSTPNAELAKDVDSKLKVVATENAQQSLVDSIEVSNAEKEQQLVTPAQNMEKEQKTQTDSVNIQNTNDVTPTTSNN
uniref:protein phosphatase 2C domain-containing protein n=1 Tax=Alistipes sp. TaxID=1872444 RepID=UPI00405687D4